MKYWLVKSEGECYSIDNLKRDKKTSWDGIRNYTARNFMRDGMEKGDLVFFYHSISKPSGIYGLAKVSSMAHPDLTAFDKNDEHYDPQSKKEKPTWMCVDIAFVKKFKESLSLEEMKLDPRLEGMQVTRRGDRLSVQPVSEKHFNYILKTYFKNE
jgi:predicted RNA-binding protein with PUA-like domain